MGVTGLRAWEEAVRRFGDGRAAEKRRLLRRLAGRRWRSAREVRRHHETLLFLRALPDDEGVLAEVERALRGFGRRSDVRRFRGVLAGSGIEGTDLHLGYYAPMVRWAAGRWPDRLDVDWEAGADEERLLAWVYQLALDAETPGLDGADLSARAWLERMRGPGETGGAFLVRRLAALEAPESMKDTVLDELRLRFVLRPGPDTPSRTTLVRPPRQVAPQREPLPAGRPDLQRLLRGPLPALRPVGKAEGRRLVEFARSAMVSHDRAHDAFSGADPGDVRLCDFGDGLLFAVMGPRPDWRVPLEGRYGILMVRNGVPVGYALANALLRSADVGLNLFDTWRGTDSARVYARVLLVTRALFGCDTFSVDPYQLGQGNPDGIASGAWWFYWKLGFRPRDSGVVAVMEQELRRMRRDPGHRSPPATLERLVGAPVFLDLGRRREVVMGAFPAERIGLLATDLLARRFGSERARAERACAEEAAARVGRPDWRGLPAPERRAFLRFSPLLLLLPGVERWSAAERRALIGVVRAKGGMRESDFVRRFDAHPRLPGALVRLATAGQRGPAGPSRRSSE
jgi:hypothetical protein